MKYCIECQSIISTEYEVDDDCHVNFLGIEFLCSGPFTYSAPPELPEDWELWAVEPDADEWMIMELNAKSLLLELNALI